MKLTDEQVNERMALIESKRQKLMKIKQMKGSRRQEKQNKQIQLAKQMMEQKLKKRMEQQGVLVFWRGICLSISLTYISKFMTYMDKIKFI